MIILPNPLAQNCKCTNTQVFFKDAIQIHQPNCAQLHCSSLLEIMPKCMLNAIGQKNRRKSIVENAAHEMLVKFTPYQSCIIFSIDDKNYT